MPLVKDRSAWEKIKKNLTDNSNLEVNVGVFEQSIYGPENDNLPVAQVFQWVEEGVAAQAIPPRPALRVGFMLPIQRGLYDSYFIDSIQRIAEGKSTFLKEYQKIGKMASADLKEVIEDWNSPPNAPLTVELKGFNNPLIETGKLHDSITYKVEKKGIN